MSEKPLNIVEADSIPKDAKLTLVVDTVFYYRFNQFIFDYVDALGPEKSLKQLKDIKENKVEDRSTAHLQTILAFQVLMEESARDQGLITRIKLNKDTGEIIPEETQPDSQSQS
jgi:hypothetical protein